MVMTAAGHGGPDPDLYRLLGVPREASREQIAQAWRRRARAEHPDARPRDAAAPARFRVLAEAYQVLSDPARRAAYDRATRLRSAGPDADAPVARVRRAQPAGPDVGPAARTPGPPLRVGPVRVEGPPRAPLAGDWEEQEAGLAVLALWFLAGERDRPW
jgi:curved DNA-binding protein CbpA